jgi:hypothetical protein
MYKMTATIKLSASFVFSFRFLRSHQFERQMAIIIRSVSQDVSFFQMADRTPYRSTRNFI